MPSPSLPTEPAPLTVALSVRRLVEFLLRTGSIDSRFTGFDRANEGARLHRKLQRAAAREHPDYRPEVPLRETLDCAGVRYTLEGRADGLYTAEDGTPVVEEIKTTALPAAEITPDRAPEHWAQGQVYAAILARQQGLAAVRVQLTYFQIDEEIVLRFERDYTAEALDKILTGLLAQYAPWAQRAAAWQRDRTAALAAVAFPFAEFRPGQRAMLAEVYKTCRGGGQLLCQAPTGIGKTMSVLFGALKALGAGVGGPVFYLTARGTTRAAAEDALARLRAAASGLPLRSVTLTAKDKICLCETRECTPEACPYANGYYARIKEALAAALDYEGGADCALGAEALTALARRFSVCPFELGLDLSLWSDVVIGDYNYLFDPTVRLQRFFETKGDHLFLIDEAHNLPDRARDMHSAALESTAFTAARKVLGKGRSRLKTALGRVIEVFRSWRAACDELPPAAGGPTFFEQRRAEPLDHALRLLCEALEVWLDDHREPSETHTALLQLYFDARGWLRVAEGFDEHYVLQISAHGRVVRAAMLCLDPSAFLADDFARGRAAVLFSATLGPAGYYRDLCGLPEARAVALRSPFAQEHFALLCAGGISTRYRDRASSAGAVAACLHAMVEAHTGNYLAFFPSYAYLETVYEAFTARWPEQPVRKQETAMDEEARAGFLAQFSPHPETPLLGFAVLGGVFGEGVDLAGDRLIGVAIVGPGLPQVGPRQERLRDYFEKTRGSGFDYAYLYPGMNKVLQAAGRVIRTPEDRGVVLLIDDRFAAPAYRRLMPPHWSHLAILPGADAVFHALAAFWEGQT